MTSQYVVYTVDTGALFVMNFLCVGRGSSLPLGAEWIGPGIWERPASDALIAREIAKGQSPDGPTVVKWRRVQVEDLPTDRTFRGAWVDTDTRVVPHLEQAKAIWRDRMRAARRERLAALDVAYQKADEQGNQSQKHEIAAQKQALRDVTAHPDLLAATTIEDVARVWPEALQ